MKLVPLLFKELLQFQTSRNKDRRLHAGV